jgi:hypothetical protein
VKQATEAEINAVAAAMWNDGCDSDGRPRWMSLDAKADADIIRDMKAQARAGLAAFVKMRGAE